MMGRTAPGRYLGGLVAAGVGKPRWPAAAVGGPADQITRTRITPSTA